MTKTLIRTLAAAAFLISVPAFAQEADHSAHHPGSESPAAEAPPAVPATPGIGAAPQAGAPSTIPAAAGMPGGMDCKKMMHSMMAGSASSGMGMGSASSPAAAAPTYPSTKAYRIANERMHAGMAIDYSGNADSDFVRGMIAHHRGAIEMAETVLEYGKDPEIRKLAEGVIAAQEAEVATLRNWLLARKGDAR